MDHDIMELFIKSVKVCVAVVVFIILTVGVTIGMACGQEFEGVCRMSCDGSQWSGVAISQAHILSVAHPNKTDGIRVEFPEGRHGAATRLSLTARVIRANKLADLALLEFKCPEYATIKTYAPVVVSFPHAQVRGYIGDEAMQLQAGFLSLTRVVDGYEVLTLRGSAVAGMSGSPVTADGVLVGIQFGGNKTEIDAVSTQTIIEFLEAK